MFKLEYGNYEIPCHTYKGYSVESVPVMAGNDGMLTTGELVGTCIGYRYVINIAWDFTKEKNTRAFWEIFGKRFIINLRVMLPDGTTVTRDFRISGSPFSFESLRLFRLENYKVTLTSVTIEPRDG